MDELQIEYESEISDAGASPESTPAMQVPCLIDNGMTIWEAPLIIEYLLSCSKNSPQVSGNKSAISKTLHRSDFIWEDKLALASVQTFGTSTATISQMLWTNVRHQDNEFLGRCAERLTHLLDWYENRIGGTPVGLFKDAIAIQDLLLACWLDFIDHRPLGLEWRSLKRPNISSMFDQMTARQSLVDNPIEWWEP
jgi:glutathione S-transferase